jgi:hypothetical protein
MSTLRMFNNAKSSAKQRGIPFLLSYGEWLAVWQESGHLQERGRESGKYVMARNGDAGAYEVGNVSIITGAQNAADAAANGCLAGRRVGKQASPEELEANRRAPLRHVSTELGSIPCSYREAVRLAWNLRGLQQMTRQQLATEAQLTPQHVSDYLAPDDNAGRRDLPAEAISRFENVVGNTLVSQWLARQSKLTVLEEMQATRAAA